MRRTSSQSILLAIILSLGGCPRSAAALVIDSFVDPLPAHPLLPVSAAPVLFTGARCDGAACPPGSVVDRGDSCDGVLQTGLAVLSSLRGLQLCAFSVSGDPIVAATTIDATTGMLRLDQEAGGSSEVEIAWYDGPGTSWTWDVDALGVDRFEVDVAALTPGVTLAIDLTIIVLLPGGGGIAVPITRSTAATGTVAFPRDAFGFTAERWRNVYYVGLRFRAEDGVATSWAVSEVRAASRVTPAAPSTWGRLKSAYR